MGGAPGLVTQDVLLLPWLLNTVGTLGSSGSVSASFELGVPSVLVLLDLVLHRFRFCTGVDAFFGAAGGAMCFFSFVSVVGRGSRFGRIMEGRFFSLRRSRCALRCWVYRVLGVC